MSITFPLNFPDQCVREITIRARTVVGMTSSPFTGQQQVYKHPGQWWEAEIQFPPMKRKDAEEVAAFLLKLNGRFGTFLMGDPANKQPRGVGTGAPVVDGGGQTGNQLNTKGWTPSTNGILRAGDWVQLGSGSAARLYKVLDDANSNANGETTLTLFPDLRQSPNDNDQLILNSPRGQWRLSANDIDYTIETGQFYGITLACMEAL